MPFVAFGVKNQRQPERAHEQAAHLDISSLPALITNVMTTIAEQLAQWAQNLDAEAIPADVLNILQLAVVDSGGLMVAGRQRDYIAATVGSTESTGACTAIGHPGGFTSIDAALICGIAVHGEDFDDTFEGTPVHVGAVIVPAVLAACEQRGLTGQDLLRGLAAGGELACRMALVAPTAIHRAAFHPTAVVGAMAAAFGVATAAKLSETQAACALGLAGSMASGIIEYLAEGTSTKRLHAGWAAQSGLRAAALAERGFTGPRTVFEGEHGFYRAFSDAKIPRDFTRLTEGLGTRWELAGLAFKPYACGTMVQPFVDVAIDLRDQLTSLDDIVAIEAPTSEAIVHRLWEPLQEKHKPSTAYSAKFSIPFCVAVGLVDGKAGLEQFTSQGITRTDVLALAEKVSYTIDPADPYPDNYVGALTIRCKNGREIQGFQPHMRGGRREPLGQHDMESKFLLNAEYGGWPESVTNSYLQFCSDIFSCSTFDELAQFRV